MSWTPPPRLVSLTREAELRATAALEAAKACSARGLAAAEGEESQPAFEPRRRRAMAKLTLSPPKALREGGPLNEARQRLPVAAYRDALVDALSTSRVPDPRLVCRQRVRAVSLSRRKKKGHPPLKTPPKKAFRRIGEKKLLWREMDQVIFGG